MNICEQERTKKHLKPRKNMKKQRKTNRNRREQKRTKKNKKEQKKTKKNKREQKRTIKNKREQKKKKEQKKTKKEQKRTKENMKKPSMDGVAMQAVVRTQTGCSALLAIGTTSTRCGGMFNVCHVFTPFVSSIFFFCTFLFNAHFCWFL